MRLINFSNYSFKKLNKLVLDKTITNSEGKIYIIPEKSKWNKVPKLLKTFYNTEGDLFSNKLFTINSLMENKNEIGMKELILPEKIAAVNDKIVGYTMPYIKSTNLKLILKDYKISNEKKIGYLKQVGKILEKMKNVRENTHINDLFISDLHEGNFIVSENNKVYVIDTDSFKINGNKPFAAMYLSPLSLITELPKKYIQNEDERYPGFIIANENTDLFCYNIMVLNYLLQNKINKFSIEEFYTYINYLRSIGLPYELIDKFDNLFQYIDNENVYKYLDYITDSVLEKSNAVAFHNKISSKK